MSEYMMLMKGTGNNDDWQAYIDKLIESGRFRGGSILGNGKCVSKQGADRDCTVTGFMRFEADNIDQIKELLADNPDYESGSEIEILKIMVG